MKSFPLHNSNDQIRQKNTEKLPNAHSILNSLISSNSLALNTRNVLNSLKSDDDRSDDEYDDDSSNIDNLLLNIQQNRNITLSNGNSSLIINHPGSSFNDLDLDDTLYPEPKFTNKSLSNVDGHTYGDNHSPIILGNENGLPGPPRDLVAYIVKTRFVTLKWSEPEETNGNILGYSVYFRLQGSQRLVLILINNKH